ncbi:MAG: hypothetical protein ABMA25_04005 [Ilumatobacteraceae bacterium]
MTPIKDGLERAANAELSRALAAFASASYASFYVHAGAALELEVKAALVRINPLLLLDPRSQRWDHDARRVLAGTSLAPGDGIRTLGAAEAVKRLETIEPRPTAALVTWSNAVFHARNDVVHAGLVHADDHESHNRVASAFFQSIIALKTPAVHEPILSGAATIAMSSPDFGLFGSSSALVEEVVNNSTDAERVAVWRAVDEARRKFEAMQAEQREMLRAAAAVRVNEEKGLLALPAVCVACGSTALADGALDVADYDDDDGDWHRIVILAYNRVGCYVCGLKVSSRQLTLLGKYNAAAHPTATLRDLYGPDDYDPYDYEPRESDPDDYEPPESDPDDYEPPESDPDDYGPPESDPDDHW